MLSKRNGVTGSYYLLLFQLKSCYSRSRRPILYSRLPPS